MKSTQAILKALGIERLNPMQEEAKLAIDSSANVVLLSPTGTGKTLAFVLPIVANLDSECKEVQSLILVPSRELAIQIEQVLRNMGTGYKVNAVYGGRAFAKDKVELQHNPAIIIGTPGRIADHLRRGTFSVDKLKIVVLDEFDKSLEVGFEVEMKAILESLPAIEKRILTSATSAIPVPSFVQLTAPLYINYLESNTSKLGLRMVMSPDKDKLETLVKLLCHVGDQPGIIFCNYKETIQRVSDFLTTHQISHGCFYGGLEQKDRERALIKFRNGTYQLIIATDLAARGIDIPELKFIVHYQLPLKAEEFTHRNGRTARMNATGTAYMLQWVDEKAPEFIAADTPIEILEEKPVPMPSKWCTLFISGGRKDKISKGDIAGVCFKQGKLKKEEVGVIELKQDCAFVSVSKSKAKRVVSALNNTRLKKKKVRVTILE